MDIVERLRWFAEQYDPDLHQKAADEIERLREALKEIAAYDIEEGCECAACQHSAIARSALQQKGD